MKHTLILTLALVLVAALVGCGPAPQPTLAPLPTVTPYPTFTPFPTPVPTEVARCEQSDGELEINTTYDLFQPIAHGGYPENCRVYCLSVPGGGSPMGLAIWLSWRQGTTTDLDLYVDRDLSALRSADSFGQWYSRGAGGRGAETVYIDSPEGGPYYIQVCNYDGSESWYTLWPFLDPSPDENGNFDLTGTGVDNSATGGVVACPSTAPAGLRCFSLREQTCQDPTLPTGFTAKRCFVLQEGSPPMMGTLYYRGNVMSSIVVAYAFSGVNTASQLSAFTYVQAQAAGWNMDDFEGVSSITTGLGEMMTYGSVSMEVILTLDGVYVITYVLTGN